MNRGQNWKNTSVYQEKRTEALSVLLWYVSLTNLSPSSCLSSREFPTCFKGLGGLKWSCQTLWCPEVSASFLFHLSCSLPSTQIVPCYVLFPVLCGQARDQRNQLGWKMSGLFNYCSLHLKSHIAFCKGICRQLGQVSQNRMTRRQECKGGGEAGLIFQKKIIAVQSPTWLSVCRRSQDL